MSRNEKGMDAETRLRTMRILWAVFLMTVGLYALVAYFAAPGTPGAASVRYDDSLGSIGASAGGLSVLLVVFFVLGLSTVVASFLVKQAFANRAVREQNPAVLQTGLILSLALCEAAGLFGLFGLFAEGSPSAYLLFVVSAAGIVLHFPRREDLTAASGGETGYGMGLN
jgi:F0F1-type ATP synthase membrane subunit c/vacuolar-type H+-ATPase subunit K